MESTTKSEFKKNLIRILKGSIVSFIITLVLLFIFACILTFTNLQESTITPVIMVISTISILIGSYISTIKIKKNGLLNGACSILIYIISIYTLSSITGSGFNLNLNSIIMIIVCILGGMIGRSYRSKFKINKCNKNVI